MYLSTREGLKVLAAIVAVAIVAGVIVWLLK